MAWAGSDSGPVLSCLDQNQDVVIASIHHYFAIFTLDAEDAGAHMGLCMWDEQFNCALQY